MNKPVRIDSSNKIDYNIEMYIKPEFVYVPLEIRMVLHISI